MLRGRFDRNRNATSPIEAPSRNGGVCFRARAGPGPRPGWFAPARMGPTHTHTHKRHGGGRPGSRFPAESAAADSAGVGPRSVRHARELFGSALGVGTGWQLTNDSASSLRRVDGETPQSD